MQQYLLNEAKIILDLCGGTGAWSKPYKDAGYDVRLITLPEYDVIDYIPPKGVYGVLAAPPCTEFSLARNAWPDIKRDFIKGMNPVNACIRIIWKTKPTFWALENPVGLLSRWLGKAQYIYEPWWFGDPWSKKTALWGQFNHPKRLYNIYDDLSNAYDLSNTPFVNRRWINRKDGIPSITTFTNSKEIEIRAMTPAGFAQAFFEANQ